MSKAIKEIHNRYRRTEENEERELKRQFYLYEIEFMSFLNEIQLEKYKKLRLESFKICHLTDEKAFEHGFYIAYRLLEEMKDGSSNTYNFLKSMTLD